MCVIFQTQHEDYSSLNRNDMQWYKKFSNYLLENQPLLWHTRFIQLLVTGIILNILSLIIGYLITDLELLKETYISQVYERSNFVLFHAVVVLIVLAIWAIYFYRNNAFKKFYPISKFYFHKMIILLFIGIFPLIIAYIPFTFGVKTKAQEILKQDVMKKHQAFLNEGSVFFPTAQSNYDIQKRVYPAPFPLQSIGSWELNDYSHYYYNPALNGVEKLKNENYEDQFSFSDTLKFSKIDDLDYVFFKTSDKYILPNLCDSRTYIDSFYVLDSTYKLYKNDLLNYSTIFTNEFGTNISTNYRTEIAPKIHNWIQTNNETEIKKAISNFIKTLDFYTIEHNLRTEILVRYLKEKEMKDVQDIVSIYIPYQAEDLYKLKYIEFNENFLSTMETFKPFYFDSESMYRVLENSDLSRRPIEKNTLIGALFISLFLVFMFVWFEFTHPLHFLITLPIGGVILILVGIVLAFMPRAIHVRFENIALGTIIFVSCIIQIFNLMGVFGSWMNKKVAQITFNLAYVNAAFLLPLVAVYMTTLSSEYVTGKCGEYEYHSLLDGLLIHPISIFSLAFVGMLVFISLARIWKAKAE